MVRTVTCADRCISRRVFRTGSQPWRLGAHGGVMRAWSRRIHSRQFGGLRESASSAHGCACGANGWAAPRTGALDHLQRARSAPRDPAGPRQAANRCVVVRSSCAAGPVDGERAGDLAQELAQARMDAQAVRKSAITGRCMALGRGSKPSDRPGPRTAAHREGPGRCGRCGGPPEPKPYPQHVPDCEWPRTAANGCASGLCTGRNRRFVAVALRECRTGAHRPRMAQFGGGAPPWGGRTDALVRAARRGVGSADGLTSVRELTPRAIFTMEVLS